MNSYMYIQKKSANITNGGDMIGAPFEANTIKCISLCLQTSTCAATEIHLQTGSKKTCQFFKVDDFGIVTLGASPLTSVYVPSYGK